VFGDGLQEDRFQHESKAKRIANGSFVGCSRLRSISLRVSKKGEAGIDLIGLISVEVVWCESERTPLLALRNGEDESFYAD
jgi:hypothetical protein